MRRLRTLCIGGGCLVAIWTLAAAGVWTARALTPRAAPVIAGLRDVSLAGRTEAERVAVIDDLAAQMNRLEVDERRKLQFSAELRALFPQMTAAERLHYLERTRPPGTGQMMKAFDRMTVPRRQRHFDRALADIEEMDTDAGPVARRESLHRQLERMVREGMQKQDPTAVDTLEVQPFVEQTQNVLQTAR